MVCVNVPWQKSSTHQGVINKRYHSVTPGATGSLYCLSWCCSDCICSLLDLVQVLESISQSNRLYPAIQVLFLGTLSLSRSAWELVLPPVV